MKRSSWLMAHASEDSVYSSLPLPSQRRERQNSQIGRKMGVERIQLIDAVLNLCTYHHPENIQLPPGYQPPNLAISTLYWKAWLLLLVVAAFNPQNIGLAAWDGYPTLKMLMEMVMTNNYSYPPCTVADEETKTEMINRELQISQREKQEILAFESHLAAASTKQTITESNSLLLSQLTSLDPQGPPRRPPPQVQEQVKSLNQSLRLGHLLCRSRSPDFLLNIIQRQASSQSMPWLADLVQSSEGSLDVLPVQCLYDPCSVEEDEEGESKEQRVKKRQRLQKQRQLLGRLQDLLLGPKADEQTTCEVLDYFLRRLSSSQVASRVLAMKGLSLVLTEGGLRDGEERDQPMEEDSGDAELLPGYQWLLQDLPKLPLFDSVRGMTSVALQQAIHMETDPQTISAYLIYLSQYSPVEEQGRHNDLALDVARLIVERSTIMSHLFSKHSYRPESEAVLSALVSVFSKYIRRMRKTKEGEDLYSWSESQDQIFLRWTTGETATMHILVVHAMVILLTLGPPKGESDFYSLLDIWFPEKKPLPTAFLVDTSEEALLLPDWLKLRMIRSEVSRLVDAALQDLEPQQLLLFVQSFGIPVSSMSKLLQYLDQAVSHDPQTLEQNIMDKNYMAHLVEVQHERGATGGRTFHTLLSASLSSRRDSADRKGPKVSVEDPQGPVRIRAASQIPVIGPDDDLAGMILQLFPLNADPRWQSSNPRAVCLSLQQALAQELARIRQGNAQVTGIAVRLLQAIVALLNSPHGGALVMAMEQNHVMSCPLMRQLYQYQRCVPQDMAFSSLFFKAVRQMLTWLENPAVEGGALQAQLKSFAAQYSLKHRLSDVRTGFLHLADALAYQHESEATVRTIIATLKSGERCNAEAELVGKVLQGLIEAKSSYLEEFLSVLLTIGMETVTKHPVAGPVSMVNTLLLQEGDETSVKMEADAGSMEMANTVSSSGLLIDWLELLDPEVISICPDLQQRLLFAWKKGKESMGAQTPTYRPYLLALLTHQSNWTTLHQCISILLSKQRELRLDPSPSLDFLWACIHIPRIWQGRDQKTPQKRTDEFVLCLKPPELICLVDLILSESEMNSRSHSQSKTTLDEASCSLIQSRLPLLHSCCHGDLESVKKVSEYLINCIKKWGDSVMSKRCQNLLLQIYLQVPEVIQHVTLPDAILSSEGAADGSICKLDVLVHRLITLLAETGDSKSAENRMSDANMACRKLAVAHPVLLLRHLPMIAALLHGRIHLNFPEFRQQNHLSFFTHVLAILELLHPLVFQTEHQRALQDSLLSFIQVLQNFRRYSRQLSPLISKFVQCIQKYLTHDAGAAVPFLQKHSDILQGLSSENPDMLQLKSLLTGLTLPLKSESADSAAEDREGRGNVNAILLMQQHFQQVASDSTPS
ncbi:INT1 protein, partial [Polyodon spathula]|nr:INT1 protein [Polyodon spathula]